MVAMDDNRERILREAVRQYLDKLLRGNEPDLEELVRRYPQSEHQIRQQIERFQKVDSLFDVLAQADEKDFEDGTTEPDLVGKKIGSFEIVEIIGRGGMGVVYRAKDTKLDRFVAIKSMPTDLAGNSTARTRFRREAKLLASLNHPNIAVIYDIFEHDEDHTYLVLEYVQGETLSERIDR